MNAGIINPLMLYGRILLVIILGGLLFSCENVEGLKDKPEISFITEYYEIDFTVEAMDKIGYHIFSEETYAMDYRALLQQIGLRDEQIEEVRIHEANVSLKETDLYSDFDILEFLELSVYTDDLGERLLAWSDPVPSDASSVSLDLSDDNVLPYFKENSFMLTAKGRLIKRISKDMELIARVKFEIKGVQ
jgi:hypothetical protein